MHSDNFKTLANQNVAGMSHTIRKKVCMVGAHGVGKTSLVRRYVDNVFDGNYSKTLGVRVSKALVSTREANVSCVIWDVHGDEDSNPIQPGYYRGMSGFILFIDGTRQSSVTRARKLIASVESTVGLVPFVLVLNKSDLKYRWEVAPHETALLSTKAYMTIESSAKSGAGVAEAFEGLANAMLMQDISVRSAS